MPNRRTTATDSRNDRRVDPLCGRGFHVKAADRRSWRDDRSGHDARSDTRSVLPKATCRHGSPALASRLTVVFDSPPMGNQTTRTAGACTASGPPGRTRTLPSSTLPCRPGKRYRCGALAVGERAGRSIVTGRASPADPEIWPVNAFPSGVQHRRSDTAALDRRRRDRFAPPNVSVRGNAAAIISPSLGGDERPPVRTYPLKRAATGPGRFCLMLAREGRDTGWVDCDLARAERTAARGGLLGWRQTPRASQRDASAATRRQWSERTAAIPERLDGTGSVNARGGSLLGLLPGVKPGATTRCPSSPRIAEACRGTARTRWQCRRCCSAVTAAPRLPRVRHPVRARHACS